MDGKHWPKCFFHSWYDRSTLAQWFSFCEASWSRSSYLDSCRDKPYQKYRCQLYVLSCSHLSDAYYSRPFFFREFFHLLKLMNYHFCPNDLNSSPLFMFCFLLIIMGRNQYLFLFFENYWIILFFSDRF